jgi:hypothetical protein
LIPHLASAGTLERRCEFDEVGVRLLLAEYGDDALEGEHLGTRSIPSVLVGFVVEETTPKSTCVSSPGIWHTFAPGGRVS